MKFLKLNYLDGHCITICLDDITTFENDGNVLTIIRLRNKFDHPFIFRKNIDALLDIVFSDISGGDYELIDIDEEEDKPLDMDTLFDNI